MMNKQKILRSFAFFLIILACIVSVSAANESYNYVWNQSCVGGSCWIPWIATSEGMPKVDLDLYNVSAGDAEFTGNVSIYSNLNVSGTSYLGSIIISADNITTNSILSKSGNVTFYNNAGGAIAIMTSDGKVGIGTASPDSRLTIQDPANVTIKLLSGNGQRLGSIIMRDNIGTNQGTFIISNDNGPGYNIALMPGSNVGIGTSSPGQKLEVLGNINSTGTVYANNFSSNSPLQLQTGGTTRIYVDSSNGNVGIGTSSPGAILDIVKSQPGLTILSINNSYAVGNAGAQLKLTSDGGDGLIYRTNNAYGAGISDATVIQDSGGGDIIIYGAGETARFKNGGNVGIGTASPAAALHVVNTSASNEIISIEKSSGPVGYGYRTGGVQKWGTYFNQAGKNDFTIRETGVDNRLVILPTSGNVGIGTDSPVTLLQVAGNVSLATSSGNVGIGTASPGAKLAIVGNLTTTGDAIFIRGAGFDSYLGHYETNLKVFRWIAPADGALVRVSFGAADSCGAGYRCLAIPN
jgi:hypothetical protein